MRLKEKIPDFYDKCEPGLKIVQYGYFKALRHAIHNE